MPKIVRRVFISSTVYDLFRERKGIHDLLLTLSNDYIEFQPVMSEYPDTFKHKKDDFISSHSYDICLEKIENCDYMILVINKRYNLIKEKDAEYSITHREYHKSKELGIPCIKFVRQQALDARQLLNREESQSYVEEKHLGVFKFIDEITRSEAGNWFFTYGNSRDLVSTIKSVLLGFDKTTLVDEFPAPERVVKVGLEFTQRWIIRNDGNSPWINRKMISTSVHRGLKPDTEYIEMPTIYPGQNYEHSVKYVSYVEGKYESVWKMYDQYGKVIYPKLKGLWVTVKSVK